MDKPGEKHEDSVWKIPGTYQMIHSQSSAANDIMISTVQLIVRWLNFGILTASGTSSTILYVLSSRLTILNHAYCHLPWRTALFCCKNCAHTLRMLSWQWTEHKFQWYSSLLTSCQQVSSKPASGCKRSFNENRSGMVQRHTFAVITPKLLKAQFTVWTKHQLYQLIKHQNMLLGHNWVPVRGSTILCVMFPRSIVLQSVKKTNRIGKFF